MAPPNPPPIPTDPLVQRFRLVCRAQLVLDTPAEQRTAADLVTLRAFCLMQMALAAEALQAAVAAAVLGDADAAALALTEQVEQLKLTATLIPGLTQQPAVAA
jgi:hypothetical protein